MPVPRGEGLALLPGSQIPQGFHKHAAEMLLLQPCRNSCMRLMVLPRSCTILVRAVVPAAIPPYSLKHCHCSPPVAPKGAYFSTTIWKNHFSHLQTTMASCPSPGQLYYLKMLGGLQRRTSQNIPLAPKGGTEECLLREDSGWLSEWHWDRKYLGKDQLNTAGKSTDGFSCRKTYLELERVHRSPILLSHALRLHAPGTLSLSPRKNTCYFLPLPHSQGF